MEVSQYRASQRAAELADAPSPDTLVYQPCIYEIEQDGNRVRIEAPTAADLIAILRELEPLE